MKALDTNVIVRVLTRDDPAQAAVALAELQDGPLLVGLTVLLETEWVLRHAYGFDRAAIAAALSQLLELEGLTVTDADAARQALRWLEEGMDFADALHLATAGRARELITFDGRFARVAETAGAARTVRVLSGPTAD